MLRRTFNAIGLLSALAAMGFRVKRPSLKVYDINEDSLIAAHSREEAELFFEQSYGVPVDRDETILLTEGDLDRIPVRYSDDDPDLLTAREALRQSLEEGYEAPFLLAAVDF